MATALRPGGVLSLLVAQRQASVLGQALAGHIDLARRSYADPTRFDYEQMIDAGRSAPVSPCGPATASERSPTRCRNGDRAEPGAYDELLALEAEISTDPAFRALAPQVHVFAQSTRSH